MLARPARMRISSEFASATRGGQRVARPSLVLHSRLVVDGSAGGTEPAVAGFVVSKAVGNAVARNRVKRRLRHLVAARLAHCPRGLRLVVRALPAAATSPERLVQDFDSAWRSSEAWWTARSGESR